MKTAIPVLTIALLLLSVMLSALLLHSPTERFRVSQFQTEEITQTASFSNTPTVPVDISEVHPIIKVDSATGRTWIFRDENYLAGNYVGWEELTNLSRAQRAALMKKSSN